MALFLVQHGISVPGELDPEKGLADLGIEETNRIAPVSRCQQQGNQAASHISGGPGYQHGALLIFVVIKGCHKNFSLSITHSQTFGKNRYDFFPQPRVKNADRQNLVGARSSNKF